MTNLRFTMKRSIKNLRFTVPFAVFLITAASLHAQIRDLPRTAPENEGVPSEAVAAVFDSLMAQPRTEIHSVMVVRRGKVIGEIHPAPFAPEYRHTLYSCSKTFVAAAVGLAVADNRLRLTDRVAAFFPESLPDSVSPHLADMTVHHLLTMTSGITPDWEMRGKRTDWTRAFLSKTVKKPGEKFEYDSMSTYLLSAIVQKVTGMTLLDYLTKKLFRPMNITEAAWEMSPEGIHTGGWGLHIQSESMAKFGLLLLRRGVWEGRRLLPDDWVERMTSRQIATEGGGYGYQTWMDEYSGAVRADGALGQYILMIPDKEMVIVVTQCTRTNGSQQRKLIRERLIPHVKEETLPPGKAYALLLKKQKAYALPTVQGKPASPSASTYADKTIALEPNAYGWTSLHLRFRPREVMMTVTMKDGKAVEFAFGYRKWLTKAIDAYPPYSISPIDRFKGIELPLHAAGSYAWPSADTLRLKVHYVDWVSAIDLSLCFENENVRLRVSENFSDGEQTIQGKCP